MIAPAVPPTALPMESTDQAKVMPETMSRKNIKANEESDFPQRLYKMLECASEESFDDVISWEPSGRSFMVRKPQKFATEVMPR